MDQDRTTAPLSPTAETGPTRPGTSRGASFRRAGVVAVVACAEIANARARRGESHRPLMLAAAGLTVVNALVAFLW